MNQSLSDLTSRLDAHSSFAGLAIHDFRYWENMPSGGGGGDQPGPGPDPEPVPDPGPEGNVPDADPVVRDSMVRGTYIWEANQVLQNGQEIIGFAKEKKLNWLYVRLDLQQPFSAYQAFVKQASAAGIEVHAMGGTRFGRCRKAVPK